MKFHFSGFFSKASAKIAAFHKIHSRPVEFLTYLRNYKKIFIRNQYKMLAK